jgi:4-hydroxybenzoate polyprenyltransferase
LLYLLAHTSHKIQPLDKSVFSALKTYFRQNTKALAYFTASAPVNKQRFPLCYRDASRRGMIAHNIISGFRNTGIWPYNPSKVLDDPEAFLQEGGPIQNTLPTPSRPTHTAPDLLSTPQKSQDIYRALPNARSTLLLPIVS